jgi:hypothetical protein
MSEEKSYSRGRTPGGSVRAPGEEPNFLTMHIDGLAGSIQLISAAVTLLGIFFGTSLILSGAKSPDILNDWGVKMSEIYRNAVSPSDQMISNPQPSNHSIPVVIQFQPDLSLQSGCASVPENGARKFWMSSAANWDNLIGTGRAVMTNSSNQIALLAISDGPKIMDVFVHPGRSSEVALPPGDYVASATFGRWCKKFTSNASGSEFLLRIQRDQTTSFFTLESLH